MSPLGQSEALFYDYSFLNIGGKTYLYERAMAPYNGINYDNVMTLEQTEARYGAIEFPATDYDTRRIYALTPDGHAKLLCGFHPRPRPEEFM